MLKAREEGLRTGEWELIIQSSRQDSTYGRLTNSLEHRDISGQWLHTDRPGCNSPGTSSRDGCFSPGGAEEKTGAWTLGT